MQNVLKKSKKTEKLLQKFYDVNLTDPFLLEVANRYNEHLSKTGEHDESIMAEGYDYLENKFQALLKNMEDKRRKINKNDKKGLKNDANGNNKEILDRDTSK